MGLLSKIFNTNKLEYILREEEEFSVTAPKEWNIQILYDGDLITPDMWNREKLSLKNYIYDPDQDWTIIAEEDPNFVILNSKGGVKIMFKKDTVNSLLKPEYKIDVPINESDEFNVEAPKEWNVTELTVGDTITNDMIKDSDLFGWKEDGTNYKIIEFATSGINKDHFKITYRDSKNLNHLHIINLEIWNKKILKSKYQLVKPLTESDEDWTIDNPSPEWNIETLTVGDYITPDMWTKDIDNYFTGQEEAKLRFKKLMMSKPVKINFVTRDGGDNTTLFGLEGTGFIFWNDMLSPQYKVVEKDLLEQDEDWTVGNPSPKWNVIELGIGDYITPEMVDVPKDKRQWNMFHTTFGEPKRVPGWEIIQFFFNSRGVYVRVQYQGNWSDFQVDKINNNLKPQFKITPPTNETKLSNLLEIDDEFNVTAPEEWNQELLTIGDIITPDMWDKQKFNNFFDYYPQMYDKTIQDSYLIKNIQYDEGALVSLNSVTTGKGFGFNGTPEELSVVNDVLKDNYKVISPNMNESEDEFNVIAPTEWNVEFLTVGDYITPDMWEDDVEEIFADLEQGKLFKKLITKPVKIDHVLEGDNIYFTVEGVDPVFTNDVLLPQYQVVKDKYVLESEDEFNVNAPTKWNVTELTVGDEIEPHMWDLNNVDLYDFIDDPNENWIIDRIDDRDIQILTLTGGETWCRVDDLNGVLKPQFKIVEFLSENEFNVDAPQGWDVIELTVGNTITPDMIQDQIHDKFTLLKGENGKLGFKILDIKDSDDGSMVRLQMLNSSRLPVYWNIKTINDKYLKPQYKVIPNSFDINESEDEFNVDAPSEWNASDLEVGSIVTPDMWDETLKGFIFVYDRVNTVLSKSHTIIKIISAPIGGIKYFDLYFNIDGIPKSIHSSFLKPQYHLFKGLNESEEEDFNVIAPDEWNQEYLTAGDTITPEMWDVSKLVTQLKYYFKKPVEISWIGYSEFDDGEEELLVNINLGSKYMDFDINHVNDLLKPLYKIVQNKALTEEEEDFNVDAPTEWDYELLTIGDTITPDMWNNDVTNLSSIKQFNHVLKKSFTIKDISRLDFGEGVYYLIQLDDDTYIYSSYLKPQYKIIPNLSENDDEFNVDAPENWNVEELGIGSILDPSNLKMQDYSKKYEIIDFKKSVWGDSVIVKVFKLVEEPIPGTIRITKQWKHIKNSSIDLDTLDSRLKNNYKITSNLNESDDEFNVSASPKWDIIELGVGDYINSNMLNPKDNDYTWFSRRKLFIEDIYFDECWTVNLLHVESNYHTPFCIDYINEDVLNDKYKIMTSLNELSKLLEVDDEFNVEAPKEWDVIDLEIGDKITRDMIKNPDFLDQMDENFRMDFPGVITMIYKSGVPEAEHWGVRIRFQDVGWRKYLPKSKDIKLGLGFSLDGFNKNTLKPQYQIKEPVFELSSLLENEEDFNVNAPDEWNVELLTVGDTVTPEMWGYEQINSWFDISKPLTIEDIGEDDGGWWIQLGRSEAPFDLDEVNEFLKSQYKIVPYILEESDDDEFNVSASPEWNVTELGVGDIITPDMWDYKKDGEEFENKIAKSFIINKIEKDDAWDGGWGVYISTPEFSQANTLTHKLDGLGYGLDELNNHLKSQYKIFIPGTLNENEEDFNVNAPEEWNDEFWDDYEGNEEDVYNSFQNFVYRVLKKRKIKDEIIETYLDAIFTNDDVNDYSAPESWWEYVNISSSKLIEDFNDWFDAENDSGGYANMNESDDEFSVSAPESWWEYDGDIEIMFQDTYYYEDENRKEAIVERDGGGILNINDLKQYSYSNWKPFTGNPTSENLTKWYSSIDWDIDLIEIFSFDDSIFEVEEDFDWSSAENVDMDRTDFRIRAVSTLKEVEDEFTVKPSKKWDIVYLNKGDFLDNTNSTFTDQDIKYEIGNITSDGEIEVKKYINRGDGFEPQFDRFMKTRKGIVKSKLKPGFDIETSSK